VEANQTERPTRGTKRMKERRERGGEMSYKDMNE
jgi:hypothetical protein